MQQSTHAAQTQRSLAAEPTVAPPSFADQMYGLRDRVLATSWFQRWAASFPLTRRTANRNARALFDVCAGFVYSQVLYSCVKLRLFDILAEQPATIEDLAPQLDLSVEATSRLVHAAQSLGLVAERSGGRIGLAMLGAALRGNPGALVMIEHHALLYADLADPIALLKGTAGETKLSRYWPYAADANASALPESEVAPYTALMAQSQSLIADDVLSAYAFSKHLRLMDVGGGDGSFLEAAGQRCPNLSLQLFDLPAVAEKAATRLARSGLGARAMTVGGDFRSTPLPKGADIISLVRIALDHDDETVRTLLRAIHAALPRGGTIAIAEPMRGQRGAETVGDAYFGFYLLAMGRGRARSPSELRTLLEVCGFGGMRVMPTRRPILTSLIVAKKQ
jgi:demethylspheroidene O-methyltransferase